MSFTHRTGANNSSWGNHTNQFHANSTDFEGLYVSDKIDPAKGHPYPKVLKHDFNPKEEVLTLGWSHTFHHAESDGTPDATGWKTGTHGWRRANGITHNNSEPHNFEFDGTDDYLDGKTSGSSEYGGYSVSIDGDESWTMCQWFKYNNVNHYAFYLMPWHTEDPDTEHVSLEILASDDKARVAVKCQGDGGSYSLGTAVNASTVFDFTFTSGKWYYIALSHDGAGNYKFYVNGSFVGDSDIGRARADYEMAIGRKGGNSGWAYTGAGTKIGHVHLYADGYYSNLAGNISGSAIRQNFLATHKAFSDRIYGDTFQA